MTWENPRVRYAISEHMRSNTRGSPHLMSEIHVLERLVSVHVTGSVLSNHLVPHNR